MKAVRTNVVTTLVQVDITVKNLLMNLPWYATVPGVAVAVPPPSDSAPMMANSATLATRSPGM